MQKIIDPKIDQRLINDGPIIGELSLSKVILVNNQYFPWLILVPKRENMCEIIDLEEEDQKKLFEEIIFISKTMKKIFSPDKLNIASLGNIVKQLHVHIIARYASDICWPNPVFGKDKTTYQQDKLDQLTKKMQKIIEIFPK